MDAANPVKIMLFLHQRRITSVIKTTGLIMRELKNLEELNIIYCLFIEIAKLMYLEIRFQ